jgi:hypothetical protein
MAVRATAPDRQSLARCGEHHGLNDQRQQEPPPPMAQYQAVGREDDDENEERRRQVSAERYRDTGSTSAVAYPLPS